MPRITFATAAGQETTLDIAEGASVMEGAVAAHLAGIEAECGGACACATCMVYVPAEWRDRLPPPGGNEADMLDYHPHVNDASRLSCQIRATAAIDGLRVVLPPSQR